MAERATVNREAEGSMPSGTVFLDHIPPSHIQASVDRIDDMFGYIRGNIRIVCTSCQCLNTPGEVENTFLNDDGYVKLIEYLRNKQ